MTPRSALRRFVATGNRSLAERLEPVWNNRWIGFGLAIGVASLWGLLAGLWTPRGPLTGSEAAWSIFISLLVGGAAGLFSRSRWAMLVAPLTFAIVFELSRTSTDGPTVDGVHFSTFGILALVTVRGFHALLALLPLLLGGAIGAGIARQADRSADSAPRERSVGLSVRRGVAGLCALALLALVVGLLRPASTDEITGADGEPLPGSVAELTTVEVGGHELDMLIRGHSTANPVVLFLAGGPGGSEMGAMRNHLPELQERFTVVTWDQRGTGKAYTELDPTETITPEGYISDTIEVTNYLRERFEQDQIYLLGQSWGSLPGVLAAQRRPDLYRAYIGSGQMVSPLATDRIFYEDTLAWAEETGRDGLVDELNDIGPPPYESILNYETVLSHETEVYPYDRTGNSEGEGGFSENFFVSEYSLIEQIHLLPAFMDTFSALYPKIQDIDLRAHATTLDVPVYFAQGAHEANGRAEPFSEWYDLLQAPSKDLVVLDTSGHRPLFEQPNQFVGYMNDTVLEQTSPGRADDDG